jgi:Cdc6-like AAA superfamily ATPase
MAAATPPLTTSYHGNRVDDNAIAIFGAVHGDIHIPDNASREPCLRALGASDPRVEKDRIELGKDKLLKDCYSWVLDNSDFRRWRDSEQARLLWIRGDPGKGKTMMMIALTEELSRQSKAESNTSIARSLIKMARLIVAKRRSCLVSYFFCQSTDSRLNSAASILKGLIYLLVAQEKAMLRHVRKRYDDSGSRVFEGPNAVYTLRLILRDILNDAALPRTYLLIDALDECGEGLQQLLDTITDESFATKSKVRWLVASRNRPDIAERLRPDHARMKISLELNPEHVTRAVNAFIDSKVHELAIRKQFDPALREEVKRTLSQKSEATFLWVALACKRLEKEPASEAQSVLEELPAGLDSLYGRMMNQILREPNTHVEHCKQILRSAAVAYRPLRLQELVATTKLPEKILDNVQYLGDLVERCGSFLTLRDETIFFIHQSAKDYMTSGNGQKDLCWDQVEEHGRTTIQSLNILSKTLKRDICGLHKPGALTSEVREGVVEDALLRIEYACCYWVHHLSDHLADASHARLETKILSDGGTVHKFLQAHLLHWLEALSLLRRLSEGVTMTQLLLSVIHVSMPSGDWETCTDHIGYCAKCKAS